MALLILAFIAFFAAVIAASRPVSVPYGKDATFSWPLPALTRGQLVKVVNQYGLPVLDWAADCSVTPSSDYTHRIRSSCNDASRVTFTLLGVKWPDEGSYTCVTSSGARIAECGQNLTIVKVPPKVHIELSTPDTVATETEGKHLNLTCMVTDASPPVPEDGYSWSFLPSSQGQLRHLAGKTRILTLGPLTREDSGQYFCQARNDPENKWNIPSEMASFPLNSSCIDALLRSDTSPKAVVEKDRHGYKAEFELAQYPGLILVQHPNTYIITDWHPPCNFGITDAFKHRVTNTSCDPCQGKLSFCLTNVTTKDLGRYQCYASSIHSSKIDRCSVELINKVPIQVHIKPVTADAVVKATEGGQLTLTCVVTEAFPSVSEDGYSWSYLPSPQGQLRPLAGKTNTLILSPLTREDRGQYFCHASNDRNNGGNVIPGIASVTVDVSYLGQIKSLPDLKVSEGDPVNLMCIVDSNPAARLAWVVEGQEVRHVTANVGHYVIPSAACSDSKTYTCRASNPDLPGLEYSASTTLAVNCEDGTKGGITPKYTAGEGKSSGAAQVRDMVNEKAQLLDGLKPLLITNVVLVIIIAIGAVAVTVYCIRRQGWRSSRNSTQDDPEGIRLGLQPTTMEEETLPSWGSIPGATPEQPTQAVNADTPIDAQGETVIDLKRAKKSAKQSQAATSDSTRTAEKSLETVRLPPQLEDEGAKKSVLQSPASTSDSTLTAEKSLETVRLPAELSEDEETDPLLGDEENSSEADQRSPKSDKGDDQQSE